ncbi:hypothetical protein LSM04_005990 [Trypanosoma melophagium]|uniref:uncharacterized protein n=1 Tax=Trypanosoma melophagium TaxID=715481 RepID=UPI00351AA0A9|nr:hypothetical protein LSM04_005990 [Trypanosoma melophagium]
MFPCGVKARSTVPGALSSQEGKQSRWTTEVALSPFTNTTRLISLVTWEGVTTAQAAMDEDSGEGSAENWRVYYQQRLVQFYTTYAAEKLKFVDKQLIKYKGKEEAMFEALVNK